MEYYEIFLLTPFLAAIIFFVSFAFFSIRLYYYLMNNKVEKLEELTTIVGMGSGFFNPSKWIKYQFNINKEDDAIICTHKKS